MPSTIYIKNMVCPRCITAVTSIFDALEINVASVQLGEVRPLKMLMSEEMNSLREALVDGGFELLTDNNAKIIEQIKSTVIDEIHHVKEVRKIVLSELLTAKINMEYSSLTKLFSSVEGQTISHFAMNQKIEKVKELLFYNEFTLSEIAHQLHYSSTAHLSAQFKKVTGMTPTAFKKMKANIRRPIDAV